MKFSIVQTYLGRATQLTQLDKIKSAIHVCRIGGYYDISKFRHADAFIGITKGLCDYMVREGIPAKHIVKIGNFTEEQLPLPRQDLLRLKCEYGIDPSSPIICSVGRLHTIKGLDVLLKAFSKSRLLKSGYTLLIVGDGPESGNLKSLAETLGIKSSVVWAGWQHDPTAFYQLADIAVFPSRQEGFGSVILEAWANRVAVIASRAGGPSELIESGSNGILTDIENVDQLTEGILEVANNTVLRKCLISGGLSTLRNHFLPSAILKQYESFYKRLLETKK